MASTGRPTKYTPDRVKRILDAIRIGAHYIDAARAAGIAYDTFNEWRKAYPEFSEAVEEADGACMVACMAKIQKASNAGQWTASAWLAERRYPERYGRQRLELTGADGGPIQSQMVAQVVVVPEISATADAWAAKHRLPDAGGNDAE